MKDHWQSLALLAMLAVVLGYVLGHSGGIPTAQAQGEGMVAGRVICVVGQTADNRAPVFIIDTLEQTVMVYDYNYRSRNMYLKTARTFRYDKLLADYNGAGSLGPSVREVRRLVERQPP